MRRELPTACLVVGLLAATGDDAVAGELGGLPAAGSHQIQRPEMRSHQPYSGLQFGFRPEPPRERGIRPKTEKRPKVVVPVPVAPLMEYGKPRPYASRPFRYCTGNVRCR